MRSFTLAGCNLLAATLAVASALLFAEPLDSLKAPLDPPDVVYHDTRPPEMADPKIAELNRAEHDYRANLAAMLRASDNPRDWVMAHLVMALDFDMSEPSTFKQAVAAAPDDALVQWMALTSWNRSASDSGTADMALANLKRIEPDNASVWLLSLDIAAKARDAAGVDQALVKMAASTYANMHYFDAQKAMVEIYQRYPMSDDIVALVASHAPSKAAQFSRTNYSYLMAYAAAAAFRFPAYQPLVTACKVNLDTGENAGRANECDNIGRVLAIKGSTFVDNKMGSVVLRVTHAYTDDDIARARLFDWIFDQQAQQSKVDGNADSEQAIDELVAGLRDLCETENEFEAARRTVARSGRPLTPPQDWVDASSPFSPERLKDLAPASATAPPKA